MAAKDLGAASNKSKGKNGSTQAANPPPLPSSQAISIDEELWFGSSDYEAAENAAAQSMAALAGKIIGAKPFPESARKLAELTRDPNCRTDDVVQVMEHDPALTARLLRLVNSTGFGLRQRCGSVRHAVTLVGAQRLNNLATTAAVMDMFDADRNAASIIQAHSAVVGGFCRYLGTHLALPAEDLFTAGFLHDIGKLMLLDSSGESYEALMAEAGDHPDMLCRAERKEFGFDHGVLGAHVLKAWHIPDPVPKVVAWHHEPTRAYAASTLLAALVQTVRLADLLVYEMGRGSTREEIGRIAQHESASYLDISEVQLAAMWDELVGLHQRILGGDANDEVVEADSTEGAPNSLRGGAPAEPRGRLGAGTNGGASREVPQQFLCIECGKPSFGDNCSACGANACPEHQVGRMHWCVLCDREYQAASKANELPVLVRMLLGGVLALSLLTPIVVIAATGSATLLEATLGPALLVALAVVLIVVGRRSTLRSRFLRHRPDRSGVIPDHGTSRMAPAGAILEGLPQSGSVTPPQKAHPSVPPPA